MRNFAAIILVLLIIVNAFAQTNMEQILSMPLLNKFDVTNNHPVGKPHSATAQGLKQFHSDIFGAAHSEEAFK